jgi:hypothetical protein
LDASKKTLIEVGKVRMGEIRQLAGLEGVRKLKGVYSRNSAPQEHNQSDSPVQLINFILGTVSFTSK